LNLNSPKKQRTSLSVGQYCGHQRRGLSVGYALVWTASHTRELNSAGAEEYSYLDSINIINNTQRRFISRVVCVCNMGRRNRNRQKPQQFRDGRPEAKRSRDDAVSLLTALASYFSAQCHCQCCTFIYKFNICYIVNKLLHIVAFK